MEENTATMGTPQQEPEVITIEQPQPAPQTEAPKAAAPKKEKKKSGCFKKGCTGCLIIIAIPIVLLLLGLIGWGVGTWISQNANQEPEQVVVLDDSVSEETEVVPEPEVNVPGDGYWEVFHKWNECMNDHESNEFINLYANTVSYYGSTYTPEEVMTDKFGWFGKYPEMNERIHDEEVTTFSDTHVRIDYEYDRQKDYESRYITGKGRMELQYIDGAWKITYENVR